MLLSGLVLLIGITFITKFYKFSESNLPATENDFVVMSYNVRLFNLFDWLPSTDVPEKFVSLSLIKTLTFCVSKSILQRHR